MQTKRARNTWKRIICNLRKRERECVAVFWLLFGVRIWRNRWRWSPHPLRSVLFRKSEPTNGTPPGTAGICRVHLEPFDVRQVSMRHTPRSIPFAGWYPIHWVWMRWSVLSIYFDSLSVSLSPLRGAGLFEEAASTDHRAPQIFHLDCPTGPRADDERQSAD